MDSRYSVLIELLFVYGVVFGWAGWQWWGWWKWRKEQEALKAREAAEASPPDEAGDQPPGS